MTCFDKGTEYSVRDTANKIPAHKFVFWGRKKIRNSITKPFQMEINMMRMTTQEILAGNSQDVIYLGRMDKNKVSGGDIRSETRTRSS